MPIDDDIEDYNSQDLTLAPSRPRQLNRVDPMSSLSDDEQAELRELLKERAEARRRKKLGLDRPIPAVDPSFIDPALVDVDREDKGAGRGNFGSVLNDKVLQKHLRAIMDVGFDISTIDKYQAVSSLIDGEDLASLRLSPREYQQLLRASNLGNESKFLRRIDEEDEEYEVFNPSDEQLDSAEGYTRALQNVKSDDPAEEARLQDWYDSDRMEMSTPPSDMLSGPIPMPAPPQVPARPTDEELLLDEGAPEDAADLLETRKAFEAAFDEADGRLLAMTKSKRTFQVKQMQADSNDEFTKELGRELERHYKSIGMM
jgi:hypothetical protein